MAVWCSEQDLEPGQGELAEVGDLHGPVLGAEVGQAGQCPLEVRILHGGHSEEMVHVGLAVVQFEEVRMEPGQDTVKGAGVG